jgi:M6 family metalloprotease-like protein
MAIMVAAPAIASSPYPDPPDQFPDPENPLPDAEMFNPRGGQNPDLPILVIFAEFEDITFEDMNARGIDAAYLYDRFFGPYPSAADYFHTVSGGKLNLTPAPNTDTKNNGNVDDGIVSVSVDMPKAKFLEKGRAAEQTELLKLADPYVDFSLFDRDGTGIIRQDELVIVRQDAEEQALPLGCGTARRPDSVTLDGVQLGSSNKDIFNTDLMVGVDAGTDTNLMTIVHEIGHAAFDMPDTRLFPIGERTDLGGNTCHIPDHLFFEPNAWQAMHLGWVEPTVVTRSGFYEVPRQPTGASFILYDPDKGSNNFFIVENRGFEFDSYETGVGAQGILIWRLDESVYHPTGSGVPSGDEGYIMLFEERGFAPSLRHDDPRRTVDNLTWRDGEEAKIALRAIGPEDDVMRVYFDVRGPGVLVDPINFDSNENPVVTQVTPDEQTRINVPVMNTGEEAGEFEFTFVDLPSGWEAVPDVRDLGAGEEVRATPGIVPASDAGVGQHELTVIGRSTSDPTVSERGTLIVDVTLEPTSIEYIGETYVPIGEPAGFAARVTMQSDGSPVVGAEVTFQLRSFGIQLTARGTTNEDGIATADPIIDVDAGTYNLFATMDRFGKHAPASTDALYHVPTVEERIGDLIDDVEAAGLQRGIENSLISRLENALDYLDTDQEQDACDILAATQNHIEAQSGKHIPKEVAADFLHDLTGIRSQLGCDS